MATCLIAGVLLAQGCDDLDPVGEDAVTPRVTTLLTAVVNDRDGSPAITFAYDGCEVTRIDYLRPVAVTLVPEAYRDAFDFAGFPRSIDIAYDDGVPSRLILTDSVDGELRVRHFVAYASGGRVDSIATVETVVAGRIDTAYALTGAYFYGEGERLDSAAFSSGASAAFTYAPPGPGGTSAISAATYRDARRNASTTEFYEAVDEDVPVENPFARTYLGVVVPYATYWTGVPLTFHTFNARTFAHELDRGAGASGTARVGRTTESTFNDSAAAIRYEYDETQCSR